MPKITLNELKKHISDKNLNKVYFFQGEEYLIEYFEEKLTNTIIKKSKKFQSKIPIQHSANSKKRQKPHK